MIKIVLWNTEGRSDKIYEVSVIKKDGGYCVHTAWGRRGCTLKDGGYSSATTLENAKRALQHTVDSKVKRGYKVIDDVSEMNGVPLKKRGETEIETIPETKTKPEKTKAKKISETPKSSTPTPKTKDLWDNLLNNLGVDTQITVESTKPSRNDTGLRPQLLNPINENEVDFYLNSDEWCMQEKMDGHHVVIKYDADTNTVIAANKQGLEKIIPSGIKNDIKKMSSGTTIVPDGELIKNKYHIFDLLEWDRNLRMEPYRNHIKYLERDFKHNKYDHLVLVPTYYTTSQKKAAFAAFKKNKKEGVVFKRLDAPFQEGRPASGGDMVKYKFVATLSAIVDNKVTGKSSFACFVYDAKGNKLPIGNCTVPANKKMPKFGDIVEIRYLYMLKGGSLYQPFFLGVRDDVDPKECSEAQIKYKD